MVGKGCLECVLSSFTLTLNCFLPPLPTSPPLQVNMFTNHGTVIHFNNPKVQASLAANTFTITGHAENKQLTEMLPGILNQLGADSLTSLRRLAENLPKPGAHSALFLTCLFAVDLSSFSQNLFVFPLPCILKYQETTRLPWLLLKRRTMKFQVRKYDHHVQVCLSHGIHVPLFGLKCLVTYIQMWM